MDVSWKDLLIPAVLTVFIAIFEAALLFLLIPLVMSLGGNVVPSPLAPQLPGSGLQRTFATLSLLFVVMGIGRALCGFAMHRYSGHLRQRCTAKLTTHLFHRYLTFGKAYFQQRSQSELWLLINSSRNLLELFLELNELSQHFVLLLTHLFILTVISPTLTVVLLGILPFVYLAQELQVRRSRAQAETLKEKTEHLYGEAYKVFSCHSLYRAYAAESQALAEFEESSRQIALVEAESWTASGALQLNRDLVVLFALTGLLLVTSSLVTTGSLDNLHFLVFFFVARVSLPLVGTFQKVALAFAQNLPKAQEFGRALVDQDKYLVQSGDQLFEGVKQSIEFRGLSFAYESPQDNVLKELRLTLPANSVTALVGPSGAGKTTMLELLVRSYEVPPTTLFIDGIPIENYDLSTIRKRTAVVGQISYLFRGTLRDNLLFGLKQPVESESLSRALEAARLNEWIDSLPQGLSSMVGDQGLTISTGQRQRISIARAFLKEATLILLDEATAALDTKTEKAVHEALRELMRGKTALVIAHRLETIRSADKIVVLDDGEVVQEGCFHELVSVDGLFQELWQAQNLHSDSREGAVFER